MVDKLISKKKAELPQMGFKPTISAYLAGALPTKPPRQHNRLVANLDSLSHPIYFPQPSLCCPVQFLPSAWFSHLRPSRPHTPPANLPRSVLQVSSTHMFFLSIQCYNDCHDTLDRENYIWFVRLAYMYHTVR